MQAIVSGSMVQVPPFAYILATVAEALSTGLLNMC